MARRGPGSYEVPHSRRLHLYSKGGPAGGEPKTSNCYENSQRRARAAGPVKIPGEKGFGLRTSLLRWLCPFLLLACSPEKPPGLGVSFQESQGVVIVTNDVLADSIPDFAVVETVPIIEIGAQDGPPEQEFGRVTFARLVGEDKIIIADDQAKQLHFFSLSGDLVASIGGEGEGPGEFRSFSGLSAGPGDTVRVWDRRNRRVSVLTASDGLVSATPVSRSAVGYASAARFFPDGSLVVSLPKEDLQFRNSTFSSVGRDSIELIHLSVEGKRIRTLGAFPGMELYLEIQGEGGFRKTRWITPPFGRNTYWTLTDSMLVVGDNSGFEIQILDQTGNTKRRILVPGLDKPLSDDEVGAKKSEALSLVGDDSGARRRISRIFGPEALPELRPAFGEIIPGPGGSFWVSENPGFPRGKTTWYGFRSDGALIGKIEFPPGSEVLEITESCAIVLTPHPLDVPIIQVHRLRFVGNG